MRAHRHALLILACCAVTSGSNLANPATPLPGARIGVGVSYHLGAHTIGANEIPSLFNRFQCRLTYAPVGILNVGIDAGAAQIDVAADTTASDTFALFHGSYLPSGGINLKASSPFFLNGLFAIVAMAGGTYFASTNSDDDRYSGLDVNGSIGLQCHIRKFGYITAGPALYLIRGRTESAGGETGDFSNRNNVRAWCAIDIFPPAAFKNDNTLYFTLELSLSPDVAFNDRAPVRELSFSLCLGSVTKRLYGENTGTEWQP